MVHHPTVQSTTHRQVRELFTSRKTRRGRPAPEPELFWEVCNLHALGQSISEIAQELGVSYSKVRRLVERGFELPMGLLPETAQVARVLDLERYSRLVQQFLPIALSSRISVERVRNGEVFTDEDLRYPLEAAHIILDVIRQRAKIFGYYNSRMQEERRAKEERDRIWLSRETPNDGQILGLKNAEIDDLEIVCEAEQLQIQDQERLCGEERVGIEHLNLT